MKKHKVRQAILRETMRLFEERGYKETTVEQIASAAEISTTTFYRYYASKEDVLLSGTHERGPHQSGPAPRDDEGQGLHFATRPPRGLSATERLRLMLRGIQSSGVFDPQQREEMLARLRMVNSIPELRALNALRTQKDLGQLAALLAGPSGADPESHEIRVLAAAVGGAVAETLRLWIEENGASDVGELLDRTLDLLAPALEAGIQSPATTSDTET